MQHPYQIRHATCDDIASIAALLRALHREEGYDSQVSAAHLQSALFDASREVPLCAQVAVAQGVVIGVVLYYPGYDTLSASYGHHLADIVVAPAHRRAGVGKALLRALAAHALATHKGWLSLTVLKQNAAAQAFYRSLGMSDVAVDFFAMGKTALTRL